MTRKGDFFLGGVVDPESRERTGERLLHPAHHLTTHGVIVGMTGSGKTGLGVILLEEALLSGIPCLVIDPKGDMGNLLLNFPDFRPDDFRPWIDEGEARRKEIEPHVLARETAERWKSGLEGWGIGAERMRRLRDRSEITIYTPGSSAGRPMNLAGSLEAPTGDWETHAETLRDEIEGFVTGLLAMAGMEADPITDPEHILLANIVEHAWRAGRDLDLGTLIGLVQKPPFRKLGVFALDDFIPAKDRRELAMRLNALVASPSFASWLEGAPLDIDALLRGSGDGPTASIVHLAHLSDVERHFVVTLLLTRLVTWMRRQPGTSDLRVLVYMDEMYGFAPPTAQPPTKKPILTLFKQARAHGVGLVAATQNPVDLDYKTMSNAGTWMVGRLQTERDKLRILEALRSASGAVDVDRLDALIGGLDRREFVLRTTREPEPTLFTTRWAMSYLRGSLTRDEIARLTTAADAADNTDDTKDTDDTEGADVTEGAEGDARRAGEDAAPGRGGAAGRRPDEEATAGSVPGSAGRAGRGGPGGAAPPATGGAGDPGDVGSAATGDRGGPGDLGVAAGTGGPVLAADESPVAPDVADGIAVRYLDPAAPWADEVGTDPTGRRLEAAVAARVHLLFDDRYAEVDHREEWEAVFFPLEEHFDPEARISVDYDDRDLREDPPGNARYALPAPPVSKASWWRDAENALEDHLHRERAVHVLKNTELKIYSRVGESGSDFRRRCERMAQDEADEAAAKLRDRYESKFRRAREQLSRAEARVRELEVDVQSRQQQELIKGAGTLLSAFLGGRRSARSLSSLASRRSTTRRTQERLRTATERVHREERQLETLEDELTEELAEIQARARGRVTAVEAVEIGLEESDITVEEMVLVWIPRASPGL